MRIKKYTIIQIPQTPKMFFVMSVHQQINQYFSGLFVWLQTLQTN